MSTPPVRVRDAASLILDELAAHRAREAELSRVFRATRDRGHALVRAFDVLARTLPPAELRLLVQRLDAIEGRAAPPSGSYGSTPVTNAILAYLAAQTAETVTTAAVEEHLRREGLTTLRAHAATALGRFARHGLVSRVRRGVYRINRFHPELLAMRQGAAPESAGKNQ